MTCKVASGESEPWKTLRRMRGLGGMQPMDLTSLIPLSYISMDMYVYISSGDQLRASYLRLMYDIYLGSSFLDIRYFVSATC